MRSFDIVDVFSSVLGEGNPVAIIHEAEGLADDQMQKMASWLGFPETAFVLQARSSHNDYALRIFSPVCELAFAGHPSIGALAAQLARNPAWSKRTEFTQECKAGLVTLDLTEIHNDQLISVRTPQSAEVKSLAPEESFAFQSALSTTGEEPVTCELISTGAKWIVLKFDRAKAVLESDPDMQSILELSIAYDVSGVTIFAPSDTQGVDYVVRSFAPRIGVVEDAACGGGNACVAAAIAHSSGAPVRYTAEQGQKLGRNARIFVSGPITPQRFRIGGHTRIFGSGTLTTP